MVSILAPSVVDRGFEHQSVQTGDYKIGICCFQGSSSLGGREQMYPPLKVCGGRERGGQSFVKNAKKDVFLIMTATKWVRRICYDDNDFFACQF